VVQAIVVQRVDQRTQHVFLTDHFGEFTRPPLARQNLIAHELSAARFTAGHLAG
jgi:hypothetical protein